MKNLWAASILVVLFAGAIFAETKEVTFTPLLDGFAFERYFFFAQKAAPAILMHHQCSADRRLYDDLGNLEQRFQELDVVRYVAGENVRDRQNDESDDCSQRDAVPEDE